MNQTEWMLFLEMVKKVTILEINQAKLMTLLDKVQKIESKQANLINNIKKLKPNALENHIDATYRKRLIPIGKVKIETYLTINP